LSLKELEQIYGNLLAGRYDLAALSVLFSSTGVLQNFLTNISKELAAHVAKFVFTCEPASSEHVLKGKARAFAHSTAASEFADLKNKFNQAKEHGMDTPKYNVTKENMLATLRFFRAEICSKENIAECTSEILLRQETSDLAKYLLCKSTFVHLPANSECDHFLPCLLNEISGQRCVLIHGDGDFFLTLLAAPRVHGIQIRIGKGGFSDCHWTPFVQPFGEQAQELFINEMKLLEPLLARASGQLAQAKADLLNLQAAQIQVYFNRASSIQFKFVKCYFLIRFFECVFDQEGKLPIYFLK
jgi:hypothetical protein